MTDEIIDEAVDLRDELDVAIGAMTTVKNKLNQFIEGEITEEEYEEWAEENAEMFDEVSI